MPLFPQRSAGVLLSPMGDRVVAYDLATETAHQLNVTAGTLLAVCDGAGDVDEYVTDWAHGSGASRSVVAADVTSGLAQLAELSLVGRAEQSVSPPKRLVGSCDPAADALVGVVHRLIDVQVAFRCSDRNLIDTVDNFLGTGTSSAQPILFFDLDRAGDGQVVLHTDKAWTFPSIDACLRSLTSIMNEYAVSQQHCVTLHAGAARSPAGEVVLLPAPSASGKSTLTAALVLAGWDYLGDETIGVRPDTCMAVGYPKRLSIDASGRAALNLNHNDCDDIDPANLRADVTRLAGDVSPVARVVLPSYDGDEDAEHGDPRAELLQPREAVVDLLANTLNLAQAGQPALDAICDLAASVPVHRLVHHDARRAAAWLSANPG